MGTNIAVKSKISPKDFRINFLFFIWFKENFSVQEVLKKIIKTNNGINSADGSFVLTAIAKTIALKIKYLSLIEFFSLREYKSKKILDIIKNPRKTSVIVVLLCHNHKLWNSNVIEKQAPVNLLKSIEPTKYAITIVSEPKRGEKSLPASSSSWSGSAPSGSNGIFADH